MNAQKYPNFFLITCIMYAIVLLAALSYLIFPVIIIGVIDVYFFQFALLVILIFVPLVLLILYNFSARMQFLWGKESLLRNIVMIFTLIDMLLLLFFFISLI